ncbi:MAG: biopolymer transporter ExbD [Oligoflexia bacterium]|nr:biopolymer transporter ExbD [Oligoflexia bacterium]
MNQSVLGTVSALKPSGQRVGKSLIFNLSLTSLIDTFSVIVIFLLVNYSMNTSDLTINNNMNLPTVNTSEGIRMGVVVSIKDNRYYIDDVPVQSRDLVRRLLEAKKKSTESPSNLIVQADKKTDYSVLNPIIQAAAHAGYEQFNFAVLPYGRKN